MKKTLTLALPALAGMMLLAGAAHADYASKCVACHGADGKKNAKADLSTVDLAKCKEALTTPTGPVMKTVKLVAPDTAESVCKEAPLKK